jgi:hypothetical protein
VQETKETALPVKGMELPGVIITFLVLTLIPYWHSLLRLLNVTTIAVTVKKIKKNSLLFA